MDFFGANVRTVNGDLIYLDVPAIRVLNKFDFEDHAFKGQAAIRWVIDFFNLQPLEANPTVMWTIYSDTKTTAIQASVIVRRLPCANGDSSRHYKLASFQ